MRTIAFITVVLALSLTAACGGASGADPTGPSPVPGPPAPQQPPSLIGVWLAGGHVEFQDAQTGASVDGSPCNGNWFFETQSGSEVSGHAGFSGSGVHSDKMCIGSVDFTGVVSPAGVVDVGRTGGTFPSGRCSSVANGDRFTGAINADGTISLQSARPGTCLDAGDRPRDVMVIAKVTLQRR